MTAIPARRRSIVNLGVIPRPAAAFSPFTTTKSIPHSCFSLGTESITALRPGSPIISPRKRSRNIATCPSLHLFILERKEAEATEPCHARFRFSFFGQFIGPRFGRYQQSVFLRFRPRRTGKAWAYS